MNQSLHRVKGGYKEVENLKDATDEPVLSVPEIQGPLKIDASHLFLLVRIFSVIRSKSNFKDDLSILNLFILHYIDKLMTIKNMAKLKWFTVVFGVTHHPNFS